MRCFILFWPPLFPGGPGEGPDCHVPKEIVGCGPIPARIREQVYFVFHFGLKRSWAFAPGLGALALGEGPSQPQIKLVRKFAPGPDIN